MDISEILKEDKEKLKFLRNQQLGDLKNRIEFDFKIFDLKRQNEEKNLSHEKNLEEIKKKKHKMHLEKLIKEKMLELGRQEKEREEYQALLNAEKERKDKEKKYEIEEEKRKKEKELENENRRKILQQKEEQFRIRVEQIYNQEMEKRNQTKEQLKIKEEIQKKNYEEIRKEKENETRERQKKTEERIFKALNRGDDNNIFNKINDFIHKQEIAEENRKKFAEERTQKIKQQEILRKEKEKEIEEKLKIKEINMQKKIEEYNKKQNEIKQRKEEIDIQNQQILKIKKIKLYEKEQKCFESRLKHDREKELFKKKIMERINFSQDRINLIKKKIDRESQERYLDLSIRKDDIEENLRKKDKLLELNNIKIMKEIEERNKKLEKIKYNKMKIYEHRKRLNSVVERIKELIINKYNSLMTQRKKLTKEEIYKELFSEDIKDENKNNLSMKEKNTYIHKINNDNNINNENKSKEENYDNFFITNLKKNVSFEK